MAKKVKLRKAKPTIFYAGSTIQQNHGEAPTGHGFAIWDVNTRKVEQFVEIHNDYGYRTLTLADDTIPDTSSFPKNTRLRVLYKDIEQSVLKKIISTIRKKHNIVELNVSRVAGTSSPKKTSVNGVVENINDVEYQNKLIQAYIKRFYPKLSQDDVKTIIELNTKCNKNIADDELPRNIHWKPVTIKFDNLFSYGEGNSIKFDDMSGLYGIFSANATGKTSALDAICFALYDKTPRAFKGSHIMNTRKDKFICELEIEIDDVRFVIERVGTRKKNGDVKVDVNFFKRDGDKIVSLNGEDRRATNANIRSYVGTYEDFILTTLSVQNQNSLFIDTGQTDRKDLLSQFIGLTVFDRLYTIATEETREVASMLKKFKKDDFTQQLVEYQNRIDDTKLEYKRLDDLQSMLVGKQTLVDEQLASLHVSKSVIDTSISQLNITDITSKITYTEGEILTLETKTHNLKNTYDRLTTEIDDINVKIHEYPSYDTLTKIVEHRTMVLVQCNKLEQQIKIQELDAANKRDKLQKLKEHKYDPNCEYCINNVFVKDAIETESLYKKVMDSIARLEAELKTLQSELQSTEKEAEMFDVLSRLLTQRSEKERDLLEINVFLQKHYTSIESHTNRLNQLKESKLLYEKNVETIKQNNLIDAEIQSLQKQKDDLSSQWTAYNKKLLTLHGELSVLKNQREELTQKIKDAESIEATYNAYETYLSIIGRDGLPYQIISSIIPDLQSQVNDILSQIVDFKVVLEVDGKNINGKIIYDDARMWPLELASGMEKFISGLAIRVSLMNISNLPKANFLVIDEGLGVLDSENLSSMFTLFNLLKDRFDFLILISHLDIVRDIADNLIEIRRDDGFSYVNV